MEVIEDGDFARPLSAMEALRHLRIRQRRISA